MSALEAIDRSLEVERRLLEYEDRSGAAAECRREAWRRIDALLDQRNSIAKHVARRSNGGGTPSPEEGAPPSALKHPAP